MDNDIKRQVIFVDSIIYEHKLFLPLTKLVLTRLVLNDAMRLLFFRKFLGNQLPVIAMGIYQLCVFKLQDKHRFLAFLAFLAFSSVYFEVTGKTEVSRHYSRLLTDKYSHGFA